ncbi:hypothetical protein BG015_011267 [Linnemannia schmuckeri]|uniref:Uncharacterized protein n=1 Tax=Linnemannia schmuckeri TaxID=64567 RepID=A0A9P5S7B9_9FUNG|nr:hypothetical protein BG015_011267 [Linnemannia schmuckeri]
MSSTPQLPLELWFQILNQTLNLLLPTATTPRLYSTYILPLLLTSHTFHEHCHPITAPHLRKHKLLQLFTRWKAAHSREVHFYHHPLRTHVRYALPDRVGNPPGEEYETLYSFIKRAYLFGCESVCGTVIPVEGGLEAPPAVPAAAATPGALGAVPPTQNGEAQTAVPAAGAIPSPASAATGTGATPVLGNLIIAPPPAPVAPPAPTHHGGDGGGQGWKGHALQWHVANPTFAAEGTLELYSDVVEEYRRVVCGSPASRERAREMELVMDRIKNPHRYASTEPIQGSNRSSQQSAVDQRTEMEHMDRIKDIAEEDEEDMEENDDEDDDIEDDETDMIERDEGELLSEIEAKGGLRRRDSGHGQSSSDMDIDDDLDEDDEGDEDEDEDMMGLDQQENHRYHHTTTNDKMENGSNSGRSRNSSKREPETMAMDYQLEEASRHRRGLRSRKMERSYSTTEQERLIMDMALDKPYHAMASLSPFHPVESKGRLPPAPSGSSSASSSSSSSTSPTSSALGCTRSGSPAPFTPLAPSTRKSRDTMGYSRPKSPRNALQRSHSSPGTTTAGVRMPTTINNNNRSQIGAGPLDIPSSESTTTPPFSPLDNTTTAPSPTSSQTQSQQLPRALRAEDLDFDLASACANTFASDLAFVLARVPGLGAHFHRFEQLAKLKLHVGWAKHAQSRGGNDVFVMSCSRLIGLLAPLANTPLVSERGG